MRISNYIVTLRAPLRSSFFLLLLVVGLSLPYSVNAQFKHDIFNESTEKIDSANSFFNERLLIPNDTPSKNANKISGQRKLIATALAITLGPFGVHRLYLGTKSTVPVMYTLTLGGGFFILPAIDIGYILTNKDPEYIENNPYFFIWKKK